MKKTLSLALGLLAAASLVATSPSAQARQDGHDGHDDITAKVRNVQVGPRPYYLIDQLPEGSLKQRLLSCKDKPLRISELSIGHRGAALQFPEHTRESYLAAARMGAGVIECDVTFTKDRELLCRHSQCDLHTTTDILAIPELAAKCSVPFTPANPATGTPASARCCTSDLNLSEFRRLTGKMDGANPQATTVAGYMQGTPSWRTDLYAATGTLMTHRESIELFKQLKVRMTPELKEASVPMPFEGNYSQQDYAQQLIDEYKAAGVSPRDVYPQSFDLDDVLYWLRNEPQFGRQAVFLDSAESAADLPASIAALPVMAAQGVRIVAPPLWALVTLDARGEIVPSDYARIARANGLDLITWTLERSGTLTDGGGFYYQSIASTVSGPGDTYRLLDVLVREVGVIGVFSDWPGTVTYYANCLGR